MPNLKVNKRELRLLLALLIVVILAAFYYFVYTPQLASMEEKKLTIEEKQMQLDELVARANQRPIFERRIQETNEIITNLTPKFFGELSPEAFMLLVHELVNDAEIKVLSMGFSDANYLLSEYISTVSGGGNVDVQTAIASELGVDQAFLSDTIYTKDITVNFVGDYEKLRTLLYNIDNYEKHININSINVSSSDGAELNGQIQISASNLPTLDQDITDYYTGKYFNTASTREIYDNFFEHYPYYVEMQQKVLAKNLAVAEAGKVPSSTDTSPIITPSMGTTGGTGIPAQTPDGIPISNDVVAVIGEFDKGLHFIPNSPAIKGEITKSADALTGDNSLKLHYTFDDFTQQNQASVVFEEQTVMNAVFTEKLRLGIKYLSSNNNILKATIIGSDGLVHELAFDEVLSDGQWHYTYAAVPREVKYPFMVRRIYAESVDEQQTLDVEVLFDELSVVKLSGSSN